MRASYDMARRFALFIVTQRGAARCAGNIVTRYHDAIVCAAARVYRSRSRFVCRRYVAARAALLRMPRATLRHAVHECWRLRSFAAAIAYAYH